MTYERDISARCFALFSARFFRPCSVVLYARSMADFFSLFFLFHLTLAARWDGVLFNLLQHSLHLALRPRSPPVWA